MVCKTTLTAPAVTRVLNYTLVRGIRFSGSWSAKLLLQRRKTIDFREQNGLLVQTLARQPVGNLDNSYLLAVAEDNGESMRLKAEARKTAGDPSEDGAFSSVQGDYVNAINNNRESNGTDNREVSVITASKEEKGQGKDTSMLEDLMDAGKAHQAEGDKTMKEPTNEAED